MKVASFNINSIRARLHILLEWLEKSAPDVVLLQETKVQNDLFPHDALDHLGYNIVTHGQKSYNGVAILSKMPIDEVTTVLPGDPMDTEARYIEILSDSTRFISVYVPNGQALDSEKFQYKLAFMERLYEHIRCRLKQNTSLVVGGDFNIAPRTSDVYDAEKFHNRLFATPTERALFRKLLHMGLFDACYENGNASFTWWDYRSGSFERNKGLRIDHLLISPEIFDRLEATGVDIETRKMEKPSDHAPVWCTYKQ